MHGTPVLAHCIVLATAKGFAFCVWGDISQLGWEKLIGLQLPAFIPTQLDIAPHTHKEKVVVWLSETRGVM